MSAGERRTAHDLRWIRQARDTRGVSPPAIMVHPRARRASARLELGGRRGVVLRVWRLARGVELKLTRPWRPDRVDRVRVVAGGELGLEVRHTHGREHWAMVAGLPPSWAAPRDPFVALGQAAARALLSGPLAEAPHGPSSEERRAMVARARGFVRAAAIHAAERCAPHLRRAALRRPTCMRAWLYGHLERAASGPDGEQGARRLLQLERVAPGVSALAFAMGEIEALGGWSEGVLQLALAGEPLGDLLNMALDHLWHSDLTGARDPKRAPLASSWRGAAGWSREDRERARSLHRVLVRRAGPRVPPELLLRPPPPGLHPGDIPSAPRDNAAWYRAAMGAASLRRGPAGSDWRAAARAITTVTSTHGVWLARHGRPPVSLLVSLLVEWAHATGRRPGRSSPPAELLARVEYAGLGAGHVGPLGGARIPGALTPFPDVTDLARAWDLAGPGVSLRVLRTPAEVVAEADRMHHCVSARIPSAQAGELLLLHADVHGIPYTLQIERVGPWPSPCLTEVRSMHNDPPTTTDLAALRACVAAAGLQLEVAPEVIALARAADNKHTTA